MVRPSTSWLVCTQQPSHRQGNILWNLPISPAVSRGFLTSEVIKTLRLSTHRTDSRVSKPAVTWQDEAPRVLQGALSDPGGSLQHSTSVPEKLSHSLLHQGQGHGACTTRRAP